MPPPQDLASSSPGPGPLPADSTDPIRVLCFGDSLTSGYHAFGSSSHPYSITLTARLRDAFPTRSIAVTTSGVPGAIASAGSFQTRMNNECESAFTPRSLFSPHSSFRHLSLRDGLQKLRSNAPLEVPTAWESESPRSLSSTVFVEPNGRATMERLAGELKEAVTPKWMGGAGNGNGKSSGASPADGSVGARDRYTWTIVLGGTNDIAYRMQAEDVFEALKEIYDIALAKGSNVLALTVPECAVKVDFVTGARNELNTYILEHEAPGYHAFHLHDAIPFHSLSLTDRDKYWDDGLHLTAEGYDWMGGHIADALVKLIQDDSKWGRKEQQSSPSPAAPLSSGHGVPRPVFSVDSPAGTPAARAAKRSKRLKKTLNDGTSCDEEKGDPKRLSQGYVVVRKKDLDY